MKSGNEENHDCIECLSNYTLVDKNCVKIVEDNSDSSIISDNNSETNIEINI